MTQQRRTRWIPTALPPGWAPPSRACGGPAPCTPESPRSAGLAPRWARGQAGNREPPARGSALAAACPPPPLHNPPQTRGARGAEAGRGRTPPLPLPPPRHSPAWPRAFAPSPGSSDAGGGRRAGGEPRPVPSPFAAGAEPAGPRPLPCQGRALLGGCWAHGEPGGCGRPRLRDALHQLMAALVASAGSL